MTPEKATKFLAIARAVGELSKDRNTKVGAVAIGPSGEIRAMGYNGFPRGCDDNLDVRHERPEKYLWTEHAERNLIYNAARVGVPLEGCIIVVTDLFPCMDCARGIVQAGFKAVVSDAKPNERWAESNAKARELFAEVGIEVVMVVGETPASADKEQQSILWQPIGTALKSVIVLGRKRPGGAAAEIMYNFRALAWEDKYGSAGYTEWIPLDTRSNRK